MRQYSIDQVELTWLGVNFADGMATGSTIVESKAAPDWTRKAQARGRQVRVKGTDKSGTLTVLVAQESQLHQDLMAIYMADRNPATSDQVGPGRLVDTSSGFVINYQNMYIEDSPDETFGTESSDLTWVFGFERKEPEPQASLNNVVGS
jgi:hypothetical protein